MGAQEPGAPSRRRRLLAVGLPVALAGAAAGVAIGVTASSGSGASGDADGGTGATATVLRRDLVDRETFSGTLGYEGSRTLASGRSGTVTWLPAEGSVRTRGQTLVRVDDSPVVLMYGTMPMYRTLDTSSEGRDVTQLERNLRALGHDADGQMTVDGDYTSATAEAVQDWQAALGLEETGVVEAGRVVFLPGARRVAAHQATVGSPVRAGQAVVRTTTTGRSVTVSLDARRQELVRVGAREQVTLPDGRTVPARVSEVGTVATVAGEGAEPTISVTLTLGDDRGVTRLDAAPVDVDITKETRSGVLAVPVEALLALSGGGYGLEEVASDGTTRVVSARVGLFADGYVEVSGPNVRRGMKVAVAG